MYMVNKQGSEGSFVKIQVDSDSDHLDLESQGVKDYVFDDEQKITIRDASKSDSLSDDSMSE